MGNVTVTVRNSTTNSTNTPIRKPVKPSPTVPPFRKAQEMSGLEAQMIFLLILVLASLTANIIMTILLQRRFRSLPYIMLQNIVVVDMLSLLFISPLLLIGISLDPYGLILQGICNIQGFFHSSFNSVFLNTVSLIAVSRILAIVKPSLYHKIFTNKIIVRLILLGIWSISALISVPPINYKQGWGAYRRLEVTCWLAWLPDEKSAMAYNVIVTMTTLGVAFVTTSFLVVKFVYTKKFKMVAIGTEASTPGPGPSTSQQDSQTQPTEKQNLVVNTDVFLISTAMFVVYIVLWVPLTVMDWAYLKDWRDTNYKVTSAFIFLFLGRSIFNPLLCFILCKDIRKEFVNLFIRCKCSNNSDTNEI